MLLPEAAFPEISADAVASRTSFSWTLPSPAALAVAADAVSDDEIEMTHDGRKIELYFHGQFPFESSNLVSPLRQWPASAHGQTFGAPAPFAAAAADVGAWDNLT